MPLLVGAAAVALGVYAVHQKPMKSTSFPNEDTNTYCYQAVRTHDDLFPSAKCFKVSRGVFAEVMQETDKGPAVTSDGYAIPGLWDGHGHLMLYGDFLNGVDLFGSKSFEEVKERLGTYLDKYPNAGTRDEWIRGTGWDQTPFGRMPTAVCSLLACSR
jgi:hypothetical protein